MLHLNEGGRRHNEPALISIRDGPLEKLMGGASEVQKKYSRKGKLNEKKFVHAN